jgi:energy-coupling factor transport system ATP-binding protein
LPATASILFHGGAEIKELSFDNVRYARGGFALDVDGVFGPGIHLVSGRVGSGKSTFALLASGLLPPVSGKVGTREIFRTIVSMQFPEYHVTGITVGDEARSWSPGSAGVLETVRLTGRENHDIATLSRGELKRLHLSCVLSVEADLLVLDEPFSSLDCTEKRFFASEIAGHRAGIVIMCTHEPLWLPDVDYIWEIRDGSLMSLGEIPGAIPEWELAPGHIRDLVADGRIPENISPRAVLEARCRTRE